MILLVLIIILTVMLLVVFIIILTLRNFDEISLAEPYLFNDSLYVNHNLDFRQFCEIPVAEPYVLIDFIDLIQIYTLSNLLIQSMKKVTYVFQLIA